MTRLQPLWLALTLLTTLPVGRFVHTPVTAPDQGRSVVCYPLVGLLIGGLLALLAAFVFDAATPLGAVLLLVVWVALTGALHLDGLADCCDAWAAGHANAERMLTVMKDPACGPVAVTVLVLVLLLTFTAILTAGAAAMSLLLAAPVLARAAVVMLMLTTDYRRAAGMATAQAAHLPRVAATTVAALLVVAALLILAPGVWFLLVGVAVVVTVLWRGVWQRRIGGYTGDTVGGLIACVETAVLVVGALLV